MAKFRVLGGDFKAGRGRFTLRSFSLPSFNLKAYFETVSLKEVLHINRAPQEMVELIVDDKTQIEYLENNPKDQAFIATLRDKRRFVGVTDRETFFKVVDAHRNLNDAKSSRTAVPTAG